MKKNESNEPTTTPTPTPSNDAEQAPRLVDPVAAKAFRVSSTSLLPTDVDPSWAGKYMLIHGSMRVGEEFYRRGTTLDLGALDGHRLWHLGVVDRLDDAGNLVEMQWDDRMPKPTRGSDSGPIHVGRADMRRDFVERDLERNASPLRDEHGWPSLPGRDTRERLRNANNLRLVPKADGSSEWKIGETR